MSAKQIFALLQSLGKWLLVRIRRWLPIVLQFLDKQLLVRIKRWFPIALQSLNKRFLMRSRRGWLSIAVLLVAVLVLMQLVNNQKDRLEVVKKGWRVLESKRVAAAKIDSVIDILKTAPDRKTAAERIERQLDLTPDQVNAILHMPLADLGREQQEVFDRQIAAIRQQIAENKIDVRPGRAGVNVVALELSPQKMRDRINLPGVVLPWVQFNVIAEVQGKVIEKRMEKGTPIKEGDIIAVLDKSDYQIALQAAQASYDAALASKKRVEQLYAEQLASRSRLDDITAQVERFKAEVATARLNLARCTIKSPITGILNQLYMETGQYINAGTPVAEVIRMDQVKVKVGIPESDVNAVRTVDDCLVRFDALPGKVFAGKKHFLSVSSDPKARLYDLELAIENPHHEILPDMFARVDIIKKEVDNAFSLPLYSIISVNGEHTVFVVNDDRAHVRKIQTGIQEGWKIQVTEGLSAGERVIVVGHRRVSDGQPVNLVRTVSDVKDMMN